METIAAISHPMHEQESPLEEKRLSRREEEILRWVGEGKTNDEIATILGISNRTVEKHLENIFEKLGVHNRLSAFLTYARQQSDKSS